jgi:hypothetical protein
MKNSYVITAVKYTLSLLFFYKLKNFLQNNFFKPVFYDIFVRAKKEEICIIAPYYSLRGFVKSVCICFVDGKETILQPTITDDPEKNCLIVSFELSFVPQVDFKYVIKNKKREIFGGFYENKIPERKYKLSIATLFKYESDFLKEWLDHHLGKGIEHFYLYENNTVPDQKIAKILSPYIAKGLATHIMWPYPYNIYNYRLRRFWPNDAFSYNQLPQINHSIYKFGAETEWILNCDVDEYFYSPQHTSVADIISGAENDGDTASIRIPGFWFGGTAVDIKNAMTIGVLKSFLYSEKEPTSAPKCIFNTELVELASVHNSVLFSGNEVNVSADILRFNHYRGLGWKGRLDEVFAREVKDTGILLRLTNPAQAS